MKTVLASVVWGLAVCAFAVDPAVNFNWTGAGGDALYSNPANWSSGAVPWVGTNGLFGQAAPDTVNFPAGGYTDKGATETAANSDVTFDTRGTWWLKPAGSSWGNPTFRIGGGAHGFNIEGVTDAKAQFLFSNAVLRAVSTPAAVTTTFESGFFNFYNPDGSVGVNKGVVGWDTGRSHYVVFEPGTTSIWNSIEFRARGPENVIRFNGGYHEVSNAFAIANQDMPGKTGLVVIAGGELVTHYYNHLGGNKSGVGRVVLETNGLWTTRQSIEMGTSVGYGVMDIMGGTLHQPAPNHNLLIGHGSGVTGVVNLVDGRLINTNYQVIVGNSGIGFLHVSGGRLDANYTHVGFGAGATGSVTVTGGEWVNLGNGSVGNNGRGEMTVTGGRLTWNDWLYVGNGATGVGVLTLAGGSNAFAKLSAGWSGTGTVRVVGGTNTVFMNDGVVVNGSGGGLIVEGGLMTTPQIRLGYNTTQAGAVPVLTVAGGLLQVTATVNIADNVNGSGRVVLTGGVMEAPFIRGWTGAAARGGNGLALLEGDGGVLRARRSEVNFLLWFDAATLGARGLTIDTAGFNVTAAQSFTDKAGACGALIKAGAGTLTLSGTNTHAVTVVADGMVAVADSGALGRSAVVTNGATLSLAGAPAALTLETLTLGNAATAGWLAIDLGDTIAVTQAGGLSLPFARLALSDADGDGTYPLFTCAGNVALAALNGLEVANPVAGKAYTFAVAYDSGSDSTAVTLTIQATSTLSVARNVWAGGLGSAWGTAGNWTAGAAPQAGEEAVFPEAAATKTVVAAPGATAGSLVFESASGYTLTGSDALTLYNGGRVGNLTAAAGSHTVAAPLALPRSVSVEIAPGASVTVSGGVSGSGGVRKTGGGVLTLSGVNSFVGELTADGGVLDVAETGAWGAASDNRANLLLVSGTLRYTGAAAEKARGFTIRAAAADAPVILNAAADLALEGVFWNESGTFIKRGSGTLELRAARESKLTSNNGAGAIEPSAPIVFSEDGSAPVNGYAGLTVVDGTLRIIGSPDFVTRLENAMLIGTKCMQGVVSPALEVVGGRFALGGGSMPVYIGYWPMSGTTLTNAALRFINADATINTLHIGGGGNTASRPELLVDGSRVECYWVSNFANQAGNDPSRVVIRNGGYYFTIQQETSLNGAFDVLLDGGTLTVQTLLLANNRLRFAGGARGTLTIANGGRLAFPYILMQSSHANGCRIVFDNGIFQPMLSEMLLFNNSALHTVTFAAGGATFEVNDGITYTVAQPLTGVGGLTKTGGGTLVLGPTRDIAAGSVTNATGLLTGAYEGVTRVQAGTLVVSNGALRVGAEVVLGGGAALDAAGATLTLGKVSGAGTVRDGLLVAGTLAPGAGDGEIAVLTLDGLDFEGSTFACDVLLDAGGTVIKSDRLDITGTVTGAGIVDFGRPADAPLRVPQTFTVAHYDPANGTPDVSHWKTHGTGRNGVLGQFTAVGGDIRVTVRYTGGTVIQLK
jgi:T5SS/PEP-CTERM-associated repeat protein/autotransporter-associated beta strand protein